jgi:hypothetical protein
VEEHPVRAADATAALSIRAVITFANLFWSLIFVFMPGVARPSFQSAGSYPAQTIMNAFL